MTCVAQMQLISRLSYHLALMTMFEPRQASHTNNMWSGIVSRTYLVDLLTCTIFGFAKLESDVSFETHSDIF